MKTLYDSSFTEQLPDDFSCPDMPSFSEIRKAYDEYVNEPTRKLNDILLSNKLYTLEQENLRLKTRIQELEEELFYLRREQ